MPHEQRDNHRLRFADFLERLAEPGCKRADWDQFIVVHYPDEFLEEMRRCTVRLAIGELGYELDSPGGRQLLLAWALAIRCSVQTPPAGNKSAVSTNLPARENAPRNPWHDLLDESPYVLHCDFEQIKAFNAKQPSGSPTRFHIDHVIPEPFVGNVKTAPVILLQLNPGSCSEDVGAHADPRFRAALLANLRHTSSPWPFYFLAPEFSTHPGGKWWSGKLGKLLDRFHPEHIAQRLAVVEWFPYKSPRFKGGCRVSSQEYGFWLVRQAIDRGALIVISRAVKLWEKSVPELQSYRRKLTLSSTQNVSLTPNNLKLNGIKDPDAWNILIEALTRD